MSFRWCFAELWFRWIFCHLFMRRRSALSTNVRTPGFFGFFRVFSLATNNYPKAGRQTTGKGNVAKRITSLRSYGNYVWWSFKEKDRRFLLATVGRNDLANKSMHSLDKPSCLSVFCHVQLTAAFHCFCRIKMKFYALDVNREHAYTCKHIAWDWYS